jgi:selenocysteine-specific elongation factor
MKSGLIKYLEEQGEITLAQFRDMFGTSRKYALAFLEYMDRLEVTERVDEIRKLKHKT